MLAMILVVMGSIAFTQLGLDFFPDIEFPTVSVITTYSGASSEDIENTITRPLEQVINSVERVKKVTSTSSEGLSLIAVEFEWGTNLEFAAQDLRDQIKVWENFLPEEADDPIVFKFNMGQYYAKRFVTYVGTTGYWVPSGQLISVASFTESVASWTTTSSDRLSFITPPFAIGEDGDHTFEFGIDMPGLPADLTSEDCVMDFVSAVVIADGSSTTPGTIYADSPQEVRNVQVFPTNSREGDCLAGIGGLHTEPRQRCYRRASFRADDNRQSTVPTPSARERHCTAGDRRRSGGQFILRTRPL